MSNQSKGINTFQRYLSVWVLFCMVIGVTIGHFFPAIPATLGQFQISGISIPIAVLIWVMIYPMMMKVDFQSVKQIGKNPKGLLVTWVTNWLIKPFTMYGIPVCRYVSPEPSFETVAFLCRKAEQAD